MSAGVVVGGKLFYVEDEMGPIPCFGPQDHGITFDPGEGHNRRRTERPRAVVWHWTGGERSPDKMADTLKRRGYGVEFAVSELGVIYQFADPVFVDTADVGGFNAPSAGVEVVNIGYRRAKGFWNLHGRAPFKGRIHGTARTFASFHPWQLRACRALADTLSAALIIPRIVPRDSAGNVELSTIDLRSYHGHLGHYHVSKRKLDPGPQLIQALGDHFADAPREPEQVHV